MTDETQTAIQLYSDEVKRARLIEVMELQATEHLNVSDACERADLPTRTFYAWLQEGVLTDYLTELQESRAKQVQIRAAGAMPDVVDHMIKIATGQIEVRGASPIAAAKWLATLATLDRALDIEDEDRIAPPRLEVQQMVFNVINGRPQLDGRGRLVVTDAEYEEVDA